MSSTSYDNCIALAASQQLLRERLAIFLSDIHPMMRPDLLAALQMPGKLLSHDHRESDAEGEEQRPPAGLWPLVTLLVAQNISPEVDGQIAGNVAVAIECLICALDLLDDVEDGDQTPMLQALGAARVLNISTALLALAQRAILSLVQQNVASSLVIGLLSLIQEALLV